jgi:hypothetical protein
LGTAVSGDPGTGKFWAFFPLVDETTLSGILNAPWKTNDDRTSLLPGAFNEELIKVGVDLVIANLPRIYRAEDPGWHFDVLPARGREARSWADGILTAAAYEAAGKAHSVPDQLGVLRRPCDILIHPREIPRAALELWATQPSRPAGWCHFSIETRRAQPRVDRLFERCPRQIADYQRWLAALAVPEKPATYAAPIRVAGAVLEHEESARSWINKAWILIDQRGTPHQIAAGSVFLADRSFSSSVVCVLHPSLRDDDSLRAPLTALGVKPVTRPLNCKRCSARNPEVDRAGLEHCWDLIHAAGGEAVGAIAAFREHAKN